MKRRKDDHFDPDDMFADTRMSFGEHIEDLRTHLLRALWGFLIAFVIAIPLGKPVLRFIAAPVEEELRQYYIRYDDVRARKIKEDMAADKFQNIMPVPMTTQI